MSEDRLALKGISDLSPEERVKLKQFSSGETDIDEYLHKYAYGDQICNLTRTFVIMKTDLILGYFTLTSDRAAIIKSSKLSQKLPTHDHFIHRRDSIPAVQIHHFAVDKEYQNRGYGSQIMKTLIVFINVTILPHMGASLLTVNSIKSAVGFYHKQGFDKTGNSRDTVNTNMALVLSDVT